uniref:Putative ovule protein n=2 Tax=Solanum chacoense TaxID=4108 RepID=A0A0V0GKU6_SOLCH
MLYSSTLRICWRSSKRSQKKKSRRMLLTEILTNLLVLIHLFLSFYTNNKRYNTIPFNFMDGIGPISETASLPPRGSGKVCVHSTPYLTYGISLDMLLLCLDLPPRLWSGCKSQCMMCGL